MYQVVSDRFVHAEGNLRDAIVAAFPPRDRDDPEAIRHPSRGVRCDGRLYIVRPVHDDHESVDADAVRLTVIDESRIADVGTIADPDPDPDPDEG